MLSVIWWLGACLEHQFRKMHPLSSAVQGRNGGLPWKFFTATVRRNGRSLGKKKTPRGQREDTSTRRPPSKQTSKMQRWNDGMPWISVSNGSPPLCELGYVQRRALEISFYEFPAIRLKCRDDYSDAPVETRSSNRVCGWSSDASFLQLLC